MLSPGDPVESEWIEVDVEAIPEWRVFVQRATNGYGTVIAALRLEPRSADVQAGVTGPMLRALPMSVLRAQAAQAMDGPGSGGPVRSSRRDLELALIAREYVDLLRDGNKTPVKVLSGRWDLPPGRVRQILRQARDRGMLTETRAGKAVGELTEKAQQILGRAPAAT